MLSNENFILLWYMRRVHGLVSLLGRERPLYLCRGITASLSVVPLRISQQLAPLGFLGEASKKVVLNPGGDSSQVSKDLCPLSA